MSSSPTKTKAVICPYCGETQTAGERCCACGGVFEPLSRQATHNAMGPWFVRDVQRPFQPGCSYETLVKLVERGQITRHSLLRGPTTKQFWTIAKRVPGVAHLLGFCHQCDASVDAGDHGCHACGVPFGAYLDRNYLGLPEVRPLPWEAGTEESMQPRSHGASAPVAWDAAARRASLSSFASDDELLGSAPRTGNGAGSARSFAPTALAGFDSVPRTAPDAAPSSASMRSMQRRLAQQQRTIRTLITLIAAIAVLALLLALPRILARGGSTSAPSSGAPGGASTTATEAVDAAPFSARRSTNPITTESSAEAPAESSAEPIPSPVPEPAAAPAAAPLAPAEPPIASGPYAGEFERIMLVLAQARSETRPREERLIAYEEALAVLRNIAEHAPADQQPPDLDATIEDVQKELDRLLVKDFFP